MIFHSFLSGISCCAAFCVFSFSPRLRSDIQGSVEADWQTSSGWGVPQAERDGSPELVSKTRVFPTASQLDNSWCGLHLCCFPKTHAVNAWSSWCNFLPFSCVCVCAGTYMFPCVCGCSCHVHVQTWRLCQEPSPHRSFSFFMRSSFAQTQSSQTWLVFLAACTGAVLSPPDTGNTGGLSCPPGF